MMELSTPMVISRERLAADRARSTSEGRSVMEPATSQTLAHGTYAHRVEDPGSMMLGIEPEGACR